MFNTIDQPITDYQKALTNRKNHYLQQAADFAKDSTERNAAIDAAFVLSFMLASNEKLISLLNAIKKSEDSQSTKTIEKFFENNNIIEDDIYKYISTLMSQIKNDEASLTALAAYYVQRINMDINKQIMLILLVGALIPLVATCMPASMPVLFILLLPGVFYGATLNTDQEYYEDLSKEFNAAKKAFIADEPQYFESDVPSGFTLNSLGKPTLGAVKRQDTPDNIRNRFFNQTYPGQTKSLQEEIQDEYMAVRAKIA